MGEVFSDDKVSVQIVGRDRLGRLKRAYRVRVRTGTHKNGGALF